MGDDNDEQQSQQKNKRQWVREWLRRREEQGCCAKLLRELRAETPSQYQNFLRMGTADFGDLLNLVRPLVTKKTTHLREPISASGRLVLRYLATGESFRSLQYLFPHNTISTIVPEVCNVIFNVLQPEYLKMPSSEQDWKLVADEFLKLWNFPNYIGAVDRKHVVLIAPSKSGSTHSIVLMGISDASYKFIYVDVGTNGRVSDEGVFRKTSYYEALTNNKLDLPLPTPLPSRNNPACWRRCFLSKLSLNEAVQFSKSKLSAKSF